jgi:hypothetical protein
LIVNAVNARASYQYLQQELLESIFAIDYLSGISPVGIKGRGGDSDEGTGDEEDGSRKTNMGIRIWDRNS